MAVNTPDINISPYTTTVPLVQIPREDLQPGQPLPVQAGYMGKAGGIASIADGLFKGVLRGLETKEQRKYQQANATISALDKNTQAAYDEYQKTASTKGVDSEDAKAAYGVYLKQFNDSRAAKAQFVLPDKSAQKKTGGKKEAAADKFKGGIKEFFERNPHIIPEIALMGMQPQKPGLSPEAQEQAARLKEQDLRTQQEQLRINALLEDQKQQKIKDLYSGLTPEQLSALPAEKQEEYRAALAHFATDNQSTKEYRYTSPDGLHSEMYRPGSEPSGWNVDPQSSAGQPKVGSKDYLVSRAMSAYGVTPQNAPPALIKYLDDWAVWRQGQSTSTTSEHLEPDPVTEQLVAVKTGSTSTKAAPPPRPPAGFAPLGEDGLPQKTAGMTPPPLAPGRAPSAGGRLSAPPGVRPTGVQSMTATNHISQVETKKQQMYANAEKARTAEIDKAKAAFAKHKDKAAYDASVKAADAALETAKQQIGKWYEQQVRAVGGTMQPPPDSSSSGVVVLLPNGKSKTFKNQASADAFKKEVGLP